MWLCNIILAGEEWIGIRDQQSTITHAHVNGKEIRQPLFLFSVHSAINTYILNF
jgi:hypothetical protein